MSQRFEFQDFPCSVCGQVSATVFRQPENTQILSPLLPLFFPSIPDFVSVILFPHLLTAASVTMCPIRKSVSVILKSFNLIFQQVASKHRFPYYSITRNKCSRNTAKLNLKLISAFKLPFINICSDHSGKKYRKTGKI